MLPAVDQSGSTVITAGTTSSSIDISTATVGTWVYCWVALGGTVTGFSITGFTDVTTQVDEGTNMHYAILKRLKLSGDTTFAAAWTGSAKGILSWVSIKGAHETSPDELATIATNGTTSRTAVPTPSVTPSTVGRFALAFFGVRTTVAGNKPVTWTSDAALTEVLDIDNNAAGSSPWVGVEIAISTVAVTNAAHVYTATHNAAENHDASALLYLIPIVNATPQRRDVPTKTEQGSSGTTSFVVSMPSGTVAGDWLIMSIGASGGVPTTPSGWTLIGGASQSTTTSYGFYKKADGTEGGTTVTVTLATAGRATAFVTAYKYVDSVTPLDVAATTGTTSSAGTTCSIASQTTITDNAMMVSGCTSDGSTAAITWTQPTNYVAPVTSTPGLGAGAGRASAYSDGRVIMPAGATSAMVWTWNQSGLMNGWAAALRPIPQSQVPVGFGAGFFDGI